MKDLKQKEQIKIKGNTCVLINTPSEYADIIHINRGLLYDNICLEVIGRTTNPTFPLYVFFPRKIPGMYQLIYSVSDITETVDVIDFEDFLALYCDKDQTKNDPVDDETVPTKTLYRISVLKITEQNVSVIEMFFSGNFKIKIGQYLSFNSKTKVSEIIEKPPVILNVEVEFFQENEADRFLSFINREMLKTDSINISPEKESTVQHPDQWLCYVCDEFKALARASGNEAYHLYSDGSLSEFSSDYSLFEYYRFTDPDMEFVLNILTQIAILKGFKDNSKYHPIDVFDINYCPGDVTVSMMGYVLEIEGYNYDLYPHSSEIKTKMPLRMSKYPIYSKGRWAELIKPDESNVDITISDDAETMTLDQKKMYYHILTSSECRLIANRMPKQEKEYLLTLCQPDMITTIDNKALWYGDEFYIINNSNGNQYADKAFLSKSLKESKTLHPSSFSEDRANDFIIENSSISIKQAESILEDIITEERFGDECTDQAEIIKQSFSEKIRAVFTNKKS